jgi:hypothetical protein
MEPTDEGATMTQTKKDLSPRMQAGLGLAGIVQVAFAFLAFWDLAHREADEVRGPKAAWIPAILVNWIGPASYFLFGIRR